MDAMTHYQKLIEHAGWEFEYGLHDSGTHYYVRIWNPDDERIFTSPLHRELPRLFARACEYATRDLLPHRGSSA